MALFYGANAIFHFAFLDKAVNGADIAAIHTAFNVFCTVLLFPFGKQLEKLSCLIVRDKADKTQPAAADSDALVEERFLMSPSFAIEKCRGAHQRYGPPGPEKHPAVPGLHPGLQ